MAQIPLPLTTHPGNSPQESAGRLINCYAEVLGETHPAQAVHRRAPGLNNFGTSARTGFRGIFEANDVLYACIGDRIVKWSSAGGAGAELVGTLSGTKKGFFARNNKTPTPDMAFVDPDGNVAIFSATNITGTAWPDADMPAINSICSIDGYFVGTTGDGRAFASDLNSTAVNALSFGKAESKPDGLVRGVALTDRLLLCGKTSIEIWTDVGTSPFPFARSHSIPIGLAGPYAIAGHEDGWSKGVMFVGTDNAVHALNGYSIDKVSPPDLDALIEAVSDKTTLEACVYISHGHAFWQLSSGTWTWVFDFNTQKWHERISYGLTRARITCSQFAFGKWLCGDTATGNVQQITSDAEREISNPFRMRVESGPVTNFPGGASVGRADFNFVTGVGIAAGEDPIQTDPSVEISWSDDGGITWSNPLIRKLGRQAVSKQLVSLVACTGRTKWQGRRWRIDIADPVYAALMGATMEQDAKVR